MGLRMRKRRQKKGYFENYKICRYLEKRQITDKTEKRYFMSDIAQLIDELRDYGKERKGEIADLVTRAADALEQSYSCADYKRQALSARITVLIKAYQDDSIIEYSAKRRHDDKRDIEVVDYITTCRVKEGKDD